MDNDTQALAGCMTIVALLIVAHDPVELAEAIGVQDTRELLCLLGGAQVAKPANVARNVAPVFIGQPLFADKAGDLPDDLGFPRFRFSILCCAIRLVFGCWRHGLLLQRGV